MISPFNAQDALKGRGMIAGLAVKAPSRLLWSRQQSVGQCGCYGEINSAWKLSIIQHIYAAITCCNYTPDGLTHVLQQQQPTGGLLLMSHSHHTL